MTRNAGSRSSSAAPQADAASPPPPPQPRPQPPQPQTAAAEPRATTKPPPRKRARPIESQVAEPAEEAEPDAATGPSTSSSAARARKPAGRQSSPTQTRRSTRRTSTAATEKSSPPPAPLASASKIVSKAPPKKRKITRIADSPSSDDAEMEQVAFPDVAALPALPTGVDEATPQAMASSTVNVSGLTDPALPPVTESPLVTASASIGVDSQTSADAVEARQPNTATPAKDATAPRPARDASPSSGSDLTDLDSDVPSPPKKLSVLHAATESPMPSIFATAEPSPVAAEPELVAGPSASIVPAPSQPAPILESPASAQPPTSQSSLPVHSNKETPLPDSVGRPSSLEHQIPSLGQTPLVSNAPSAAATPSGSGTTPSVLGKVTGVGKVLSQQATPKPVPVTPSLPASPGVGRTPSLPKPATPSPEASQSAPAPPAPPAAAASSTPSTSTPAPKPTAATSSFAAAKAGLKPSTASKNPLAKMRSSKVGPGGAGTAGQPAKGSGGFNIMSVLSSSGAQSSKPKPPQPKAPKTISSPVLSEADKLAQRKQMAELRVKERERRAAVESEAFDLLAQNHGIKQFEDTYREEVRKMQADENAKYGGKYILPRLTTFGSVFSLFPRSVAPNPDPTA